MAGKTFKLGTTVTPALDLHLDGIYGYDHSNCEIPADGWRGDSVPKLRCQGEKHGTPVWTTSAEKSPTAKCGLHGGGARSGVQTAEGRQRIIKVNTKHGQATQAVRQAASRKSSELAQLADVMRVLEMTDAAASAGRRPSGYCPISFGLFATF